jgi:hypothetical protein
MKLTIDTTEKTLICEIDEPEAGIRSLYKRGF